jgi:hypothetical protein
LFANAGLRRSNRSAVPNRLLEDSARLVRKTAVAAATAAAAEEAAAVAEATIDNGFLDFSSLKKARW